MNLLKKRGWLTLCAATLATAAMGCGGGGGPVSVPVPAPLPDPVMPAPVVPTAPMRTLLWADEFDGSGLPEASRWSFDTERNKLGWFNNEKQYYSSERLQNAQVADGYLSINALRERLSSAPDFGGQDFTSARLITRGKFSFTYGFVEVRAQLPCSLGSWPAVWMLGTGGNWPDDGEIDLVEQRGNTAANKLEVFGTVHTRAFNWFNGSMGVAKGVTRALPTACTAFHNYQLNWTPDKIEIGIDGVVYNTVFNPKLADATQNYQEWPFDKPQFILLNLAMGGDLGGPIPTDFAKDTMRVDYVRVYKNQ